MCSSATSAATRPTAIVIGSNGSSAAVAPPDAADFAAVAARCPLLVGSATVIAYFHNYPNGDSAITVVPQLLVMLKALLLLSLIVPSWQVSSTVLVTACNGSAGRVKFAV